MASNSQILQNAVGEFMDCPFFLLPKSQQQANLQLMQRFFSSMYGKLRENKTEATAVARRVKSIKR